MYVKSRELNLELTLFRRNSSCAHTIVNLIETLKSNVLSMNVIILINKTKVLTFISVFLISNLNTFHYLLRKILKNISYKKIFL